VVRDDELVVAGYEELGAQAAADVVYCLEVVNEHFLVEDEAEEVDPVLFFVHVSVSDYLYVVVVVVNYVFVAVASVSVAAVVAVVSSVVVAGFVAVEESVDRRASVVSAVVVVAI
jgi:hypothetical protein